MNPRMLIRKVSTRRSIRWCNDCHHLGVFIVEQETAARQSVGEVGAFCLKHARRRFLVDGMRVGDVCIAIEHGEGGAR